jgi:GGDEF domain-containing protein
MNNSRNSLGSDIAFALFLLLLLMGALIAALNPEYIAQHMISLFVVFAVLMLTRFASPTAGLVANVLLIFLYLTYLIVTTLTQGAVYGFQSYIWVVMMPLMTLCLSFMQRKDVMTVEEQRQLRQQLEVYSTIDIETGVKTRYAYSGELAVFQSLARRHQLNVLLIVWGFRFDMQLQRMLSQGEMRDLTQNISRATQEVFRKEDVLYIMQKSPYLWATVTLVKPGYEGAMIARMREHIEKIDLKKSLGKRAPKVELRIGYSLDEMNEMDPQALLESAISQTQYDVWR